MKVYLIRHTSVNVPHGIAYGQTDVPVNDTFEEEASITKKNLEGISFDQVFCSPFTRCVKLASFCGYPDAIRDNRLKELNFGDWEMKTWDEISEDPVSKVWFDDWAHVPTHNGESLEQQMNRLKDFLIEAKGKGYKQIAVFAHGGILTCSRVIAGEYPIEKAFLAIPAYGSVIQIDF